MQEFLDSFTFRRMKMLQILSFVLSLQNTHCKNVEVYDLLDLAINDTFNGSVLLRTEAEMYTGKFINY